MKNYRVSIKRTPDGRELLSGSEDAEQQLVIRWAQLMSRRWPELELLHHIPNGGRRERREAVKLKQMGVKPGVPDLMLPVARGGYHGLYIEMKVGGNKPTKHQAEWLRRLTAQGYCCYVCYGSQEAEQRLEEYISDGRLLSAEKQAKFMGR